MSAAHSRSSAARCGGKLSVWTNPSEANRDSNKLDRVLFSPLFSVNHPVLACSTLDVCFDCTGLPGCRDSS
jgi:hypothetical protein